MANLIAQECKLAALEMQCLNSATKNSILDQIAKNLSERKEELKSANQQDLTSAKAQVDSGKLSQSTFNRLDLFGKTGDKFEALIHGLHDVIRMEDPIGRVSMATRLDDGLDLYRVVCPVGSIMVIFEARPEVLIQISSLVIKSGNAVILKGGKESINTLRILQKIVYDSLVQCKAPGNAVQLITSREEVEPLLKLDNFIDLVIPRGSNQLVSYIKENTRIPVLGHADGKCTIYIDESADVNKVIPIIVDAKTNYPAACNAVETILVNKKCLPSILPKIVMALEEKNVEMRMTKDCLAHSGKSSRIKEATDIDFDTEFSDLIVAIGAINSVDEAIKHINKHGSKHTDAIISESKENAELFMRMIDSAGVYWNASTRFADGFRYGFGAEIGVSTNKTHARGPVGLEGLTIYKYRLYGNGQCASEFGSQSGKQFKHDRLKFDGLRF